MNRFKKLITLCLCLLMILSLTGCALDSRATEGIESDLRNRAEDNRKIAETLYNSGLVNESFYNSIVTNIENNVESLAKKLSGEASVGDIGTLLTAISRYSILGSSNVKKLDIAGSASEIKNYFLVDAIEAESTTYFNKIPYNTSKKVVPITIISNDDTADKMRERLSYNIHVLRPSSVDLATVANNLSSCINGTTINPDKQKEFEYCASTYFEALKDTNGNNVTLLSLTGTDDIIIESRENISTTKNYPGWDLRISQHGVYSFSVRFREFNQDAINKIIAVLGTGEGQYIVDPKSNAIYMMEYPTYYINRIEIDDSDANELKLKPSFKKSDIEVNILNGKMYKVSGTGTVKNGLTDGTRTLIENTEDYISLSTSSPDDSSFVVFGSTDDEYGKDTLKYGGKNQDAVIPRIVLRDYLELSYYPNLVENETLVAFGKKVRITMLDADASRGITEKIGFYCDKDYKSTSSESVVELFISDLADVQNITRDTPYCTYIPSNSNEHYIEATTASNPDEMGTIEETDKADDLTRAAVDAVTPTMKFTSSNLDSVDLGDYMSTGKQSFYGIVVVKPVAESGLLLWMTSSESESSMQWWIKWLSDNDFKYPLNQDLTNDLLKSRYQYELGEIGIFVLNYETIKGIQEEIDTKHDTENTGLFRTGFKVLGWLLVGYSLILMMCWVVDTNVDFGQQLLTKVTLGRMIAVADASEIGSTESAGKADYIDFRGILISSLIIMGVGLVLINADIILLLWGVIKTIGNIFTSIVKAIKG